MTSPTPVSQPSFDEKAFVKRVIDLYYETDFKPIEDIFREVFEASFQTQEICNLICNKYYLSENYDSQSLYSILFNIVDYELCDEEDSNADTEESYVDDLVVNDDYDDY